MPSSLLDRAIRDALKGKKGDEALFLEDLLADVPRAERTVQNLKALVEVIFRRDALRAGAAVEVGEPSPEAEAVLPPPMDEPEPVPVDLDALDAEIVEPMRGLTERQPTPTLYERFGGREIVIDSLARLVKRGLVEPIREDGRYVYVLTEEPEKPTVQAPAARLPRGGKREDRLRRRVLASFAAKGSVSAVQQSLRDLKPTSEEIRSILKEAGIEVPVAKRSTRAETAPKPAEKPREVVPLKVAAPYDVERKIEAPAAMPAPPKAPEVRGQDVKRVVDWNFEIRRRLIDLPVPEHEVMAGLILDAVHGGDDPFYRQLHEFWVTLPSEVKARFDEMAKEWMMGGSDNKRR